MDIRICWLDWNVIWILYNLIKDNLDNTFHTIVVQQDKFEKMSDDFKRHFRILSLVWWYATKVILTIILVFYFHKIYRHKIPGDISISWTNAIICDIRISSRYLNIDLYIQKIQTTIGTIIIINIKHRQQCQRVWLGMPHKQIWSH